MKKISFFLLTLLMLCACSTSAVDISQPKSLPSSNAQENSVLPRNVPDSPIVQNIPGSSDIHEDEQKSLLFRVNLKDIKEPEVVKIDTIKRIERYTMSPSCTVIYGDEGFNDVGTTYNCVTGNSMNFDNYMGTRYYLRFLNCNHIAIEEAMGAWIERPDEEADPFDAMIQANMEIVFTYFTSSFLKFTGKRLYLEDFDYDVSLERYYCTAITEDYRILCSEYDKNYNLLYYMTTNNIEVIPVKAYQIIHPRIIALGGRKVYTNYGVEFDFNTLTYQKKDYDLPKIYYENHHDGEVYSEYRTPINKNSQWGIDTAWHTPVNKDNQYTLESYHDVRVISYVGDELRTLYKTPETIRDPDSREPISSYEVQTNQGIITVSGYGVGAWAPDEGVYIGGFCKKYQWEMSGHLKEYFQADYYEYGIFKLLPDGTIHFVLPLPKGIDFIGEDINGMSYFYKRTF